MSLLSEDTAVSARNISLGKGRDDGALTITAKPDAYAGEHHVLVVATFKAAGRDVRIERPVTVRIVKN